MSAYNDERRSIEVMRAGIKKASVEFSLSAPIS
jgi:hypothetical protein